MKHNWEYKRLGDVCFTKKEIGRASTYYGVDDEISYFDISSIDNSVNRVTSYFTTTFGDAPSRAQQVIENGDVLFSLVRPNLKNIALLNSDAANKVGTSGFCVLRGKNVLPKYVLHFVLSSQFTEYILSKASGASYPAVTEDDVRKAYIPVPTMEIQDRIVAELDKINELIEQNRELLHHLDALAQSIFYDTFGDPVTNPKGWPVKQMREVAPSSPSSNTPEEKDGKFWLLNLDQVESNSGRVLSKQFYKNGDIGNSVTTFDNENILYSKLRPYLNKVVIPYSNGFCTSELIPLRPKKRTLNRFYCAHALRLPEFVRYISDKTGGAKMPRVKMDYFWQFNIPIPPLHLQEQFAMQIEAIEAQKATVEKSIAELQTLLDSRMDYWFN